MSKIRHTLAVAFALAAVPATAGADTIALTPAADPVEEVGFGITATGEGRRGAAAYATIKPEGATGCGPTYQPDIQMGGTDAMFSQPAESVFSAAGSALVGSPGRYLLCGWLQDRLSADAPLAATSSIVTVRSAAATLRIRGPRRLRLGRQGYFRLVGAAEIQRELHATVKPARRGRRCGATVAHDRGNAMLGPSTRVQGAFSFRSHATTVHAAAPGRYVLCAWVYENGGDRDVEAAARRVFRVVRR